MLPLITDLDRIAARAGQQRDDNAAFAYYVDRVWEAEARPDGALDALVASITAEVAAQVDCTACANCCRTLPVDLTPADIPLLAGAVGLPGREFVARYVVRAAGPDDGEWGTFGAPPCPFLRPDRRCAVYAQRPEACRAYPPLTPDFRWLALRLVDGAGVCPIIFNVIERLKIVLGW